MSTFGRGGKIQHPGWDHTIKEVIRHRLIVSILVVGLGFCGADWLVDSKWGDLGMNVALFGGMLAFEGWRRKS